MGEVGPADFVVVTHLVVDGQAVLPREREGLALTGEVVLDVALGAHVRAHLLVGGIAVDVVVGDALGGLGPLDAVHECRASDPQLHGLRVVAVDAGDG